MRILITAILFFISTSIMYAQKIDSSYIIKVTLVKKFKREYFDGKETQKFISEHSGGIINVNISDFTHHRPVQIITNESGILIVKPKEEHGINYLFGCANDDKTQVTLDMNLINNRIQLVISDDSTVYIYDGIITKLRFDTNYE